jgi:hypothetical protein
MKQSKNSKNKIESRVNSIRSYQLSIQTPDEDYESEKEYVASRNKSRAP